MTKTKRCVLAALAVVVLCAAGWAGFGRKSEAAQRATWEYRTVRVTQTELFGEPSFKAMGHEGWELATAIYVEHERAGYYTFRRAR